MKGTPETPQCGYSRASIQILGVQGVDPAKFTAFNVLEDQELRQGKYNHGIPKYKGKRKSRLTNV
jgi:glutaredoxin-related protein